MISSNVLYLLTGVTDLSSATRRSPSHKSVVPFVLSGANVAPSFDSSGSSSGVMTATTGSPSSRQLCTNCSPNRMHLDGPVLFEAPPLVEETLMDVSSLVKSVTVLVA
jgi:hypothetical protein